MKSVSTRSRTARLSRSASSWAARNPNGSRGREFDKVDPRAGRLGVILLPVLLVQVGYFQRPLYPLWVAKRRHRHRRGGELGSVSNLGTSSRRVSQSALLATKI